MMIVFLDDNKERTKKFKSEIPSAVCVETAMDAMNAIRKYEPIDTLLLDHDLGGEEYQNSDDTNTGMEVVRWIVANEPRIGNICIHSCNVPAAQRMYDTLVEAGYTVYNIPFPNLLKHICNTTL